MIVNFEPSNFASNNFAVVDEEFAELAFQCSLVVAVVVDLVVSTFASTQIHPRQNLSRQCLLKNLDDHLADVL